MNKKERRKRICDISTLTIFWEWKLLMVKMSYHCEESALQSLQDAATLDTNKSSFKRDILIVISFDRNFQNILESRLVQIWNNTEASDCDRADFICRGTIWHLAANYLKMKDNVSIFALPSYSRTVICLMKMNSKVKNIECLCFLLHWSVILTNISQRAIILSRFETLIVASSILRAISRLLIQDYSSFPGQQRTIDTASPAFRIAVHYWINSHLIQVFFRGHKFIDITLYINAYWRVSLYLCPHNAQIGFSFDSYCVFIM